MTCKQQNAYDKIRNAGLSVNTDTETVLKGNLKTNGAIKTLILKTASHHVYEGVYGMDDVVTTNTWNRPQIAVRIARDTSGYNDIDCRPPRNTTPRCITLENTQRPRL